MGKNKIALALITLAIISTGCASDKSAKEAVATLSNALVISKPITFGDVSFSLGEPLGDNLLYVIGDNEVYTSGRDDELTRPLGTFTELEKYMKENVHVIENKEQATNEQIDSYITGYGQVANVRVLGGTVGNSYMTLTVYNNTDEHLTPSESVVKNLWILGTPIRDGKEVNVSYNGFTLGEDISSVDLSDYTEADSDYADKEYSCNSDVFDETVYVKDNKVYGFKLSY